MSVNLATSTEDYVAHHFCVLLQLEHAFQLFLPTINYFYGSIISFLYKHVCCVDNSNTQTREPRLHIKASLSKKVPVYPPEYIDSTESIPARLAFDAPFCNPRRSSLDPLRIFGKVLLSPPHPKAPYLM